METEPVGFFITWTGYGTWLPGDPRGWINWHRGYRTPQPLLEDWCRGRLREAAVSLEDDQRVVVVDTISRHCQIRQWHLHEKDCRSNHVHVVVTAPGCSGSNVRDQFKAWCTRHLKEKQRSSGQSIRARWWAEGGSVRVLFDEDALQAAIEYVRDGQDKGGSHAGHEVRDRWLAPRVTTRSASERSLDLA